MQKDLDFYEQHIVWRKMTETQFMNYNKGKYWSIFVEHNIKLL
jgi:hypothetical protein